MPLHPAGHRVIFSMSQKRMVTIWARFVWFFFKLHLGNQNVHFLLLQFLACRCEIRSSEIHTEDKKFRQTEKLVVKSITKCFSEEISSVMCKKDSPFLFSGHDLSFDTAGSYHAGYAKQNMLVVCSRLAYLLLFVDFCLLGEHITLLCLITQLACAYCFKKSYLESSDFFFFFLFPDMLPLLDNESQAVSSY